MPIHKRMLRSYAAAILISLTTAIPSFGATANADLLSRIAIGNFGRVNDNYYRGAQPKQHDYADLAALGIKTVIDLTRDGEAAEPSAVQTARMKFFRIPLTTTAQPSREAVDQFLKLVNDPANQPVYVHCQGGRHRTGVMTAIYRLTHDGWTADRAFGEMKQFQFEKGFVSHAALKNFVYSFYTQLAHTAIATAEQTSGKH